MARQRPQPVQGQSASTSLSFLFIVQGDGRSHMTQALALRDVLVDAGHSVSHVIIGKTHQRTIPDYFFRKIRAPVTTIANPELVTDANKKAIRLLPTVRFTLSNIGAYLRGLRQIQRTVATTDPDVIINFYNLLAGIFSSIYRPPVPMISIGHQYILQHPSYEFPEGHRIDRFLVRLYTRLTAGRSTKKLALSFYPLPADTRTHTVVVPPLLRTEVSQLGPTCNQGFLLVYVLNTGYYEDIVRWHREHDEVTVHCFLDDKGIDDASYSAKNFTVHRLNDEVFLRLMAHCAAVICTAGFDTVCEACYLNKPIAVVPVEGHFEQLLNALDAEGAHVAQYMRHFDVNDLVPHIKVDSARSDRFRRWVSGARERILEELV